MRSENLRLTAEMEARTRDLTEIASMSMMYDLPEDDAAVARALLAASSEVGGATQVVGESFQTLSPLPCGNTVTCQCLRPLVSPGLPL